MALGTRRGVVRFCVLATALATVGASSAQAGGYPWDWGHHTIPRETPALDYRTGDIMMAPPIPYGEYAKDYAGSIHEYIGKVCGLCHAAACSLCGGCGLFHGQTCHGCGGDGCSRCHGNGHLLTVDGPGAAGDPSTAAGSMPHGAAGGNGPAGDPGQGFAHGHDSGVAPAGAPCGPGALPSSQVTCHACGGRGVVSGRACGLCGGRGVFGGLRCGRCHGAGCGACGGSGMVDPSSVCQNCGGRGCKLCRGLGLHNPLGLVHGLLAGALHHGGIKYFVGAGGPVPLTPGYVPYVVTTRSPRDYFAFPPFSDQSQP